MEGRLEEKNGKGIAMGVIPSEMLGNEDFKNDMKKFLKYILSDNGFNPLEETFALYPSKNMKAKAYMTGLKNG